MEEAPGVLPGSKTVLKRRFWAINCKWQVRMGKNREKPGGDPKSGEVFGPKSGELGSDNAQKQKKPKIFGAGKKASEPCK